MRIESAELHDREELRTLLLDAAEQLAGPHTQVLEPRLPWDGHPLLLVDAARHPVLVSFDPVNAQAALLNGLNSVQMLATALPWLNRVYEALEERQLPPRLVVVTPEPPPGASTILTGCRDLRLLQYRALRVNGETGLLLEPGPGEDAAGPASPPREPEPVVVPDTDGAAPVRAVPANPAEAELSLTPDEESYFQQL